MMVDLFHDYFKGNLHFSDEYGGGSGGDGNDDDGGGGGGDGDDDGYDGDNVEWGEFFKKINLTLLNKILQRKFRRRGERVT